MGRASATLTVGTVVTVPDGVTGAEGVLIIKTITAIMAKTMINPPMRYAFVILLLPDFFGSVRSGDPLPVGLPHSGQDFCHSGYLQPHF
jgi:hypothetical protein